MGGFQGLSLRPAFSDPAVQNLHGTRRAFNPMFSQLLNSVFSPTAHLLQNNLPMPRVSVPASHPSPHV